MKIRTARPSDAAAITDIYNHYIRDTIITFETTELRAEEMQSRVETVLKTHDWIVAESADGVLMGYAYFGTFKVRAAYGGTVESSVYLSPDATGKGLGRLLYTELLKRAKAADFRQVIGVLSVPNTVSEQLHASFGFKLVGLLQAVGRKFEQDIDVAYWQLTL